MSLFNELRVKLETYLDEKQIAQIEKAYLLAEKAHEGQKRHSGEDYITHPIAVSEILADMHIDAQSIMAALLHDVIEDTGIEKSYIAKEFGETVAELVDGVSKLTKIKFESKAEAQAENFRKMLLAMAADIRVILIKLADRLHNMQTLGVVPPEKRRRIAKETLEIYAPIANRLGMHDFFVEFEDRGFQALSPMRYRILKTGIKKARGNRKEIVHEIENALTKQLEKFKIKCVEIKGREKHLYSIYKKMKNKRIPFNEIMDVYAFRIVVDSVDTCYRVLGVVHNLYKPIPERFKDYIAIPKINDYQSLHTTLFGPYGVPIEIQIRTSEMQHIAESGIAAHWLYKSPNLTPDKAQLHAREWLKSLMEMQEKVKSPLEFIENVKIDLFPVEIYVFSPKGDIFELPSKSTAVDFAYAIHSDIGNTCIATKINRRVAPLSTELVNGQTVEIITAPGARPNPAWLNFVVTTKARSHIRQYIREQRRTESIDLGKEILAKTLIAMSSNIEKIKKSQVDETLKQLHFKKINHLYEAIGLGRLLPMVAARTLLDEPHTKDSKPKELIPLFIRGCQGMLVHFAKCCHPIPGDPIIGVFKPGEGLIIHQIECEVIQKLRKNPDKYIDVQWEEEVQGEFKVILELEVLNERGVLAKLATTIAAAEANIEDIAINNNEGKFTAVLLTISVRNRIHLAKIMRRLREMKVVSKITRK